jgi:dGTPase
MTDEMHERTQQLKLFLRDRVYRHQRVLRMTTKARRTVRALFEAFMEEPRLMPAEYFEHACRLEAAEGLHGRARIVADFIAGMTDRYAIGEYSRLFDPSERT